MICEEIPVILDIRRQKLRQPLIWCFGTVEIRTEATPCHLGGVRHWLVCPGCGRRCLVIYQGLRCRLCLGARYCSEHLSLAAWRRQPFASCAAASVRIPAPRWHCRPDQKACTGALTCAAAGNLRPLSRSTSSKRWARSQGASSILGDDAQVMAAGKAEAGSGLLMER